MSGVGFFGCKRDTFDHRDHHKVYEMVPSCHSHPQVDLRKNVEKVYDQGRIRSCTANAVCAAYAFDLKKEMPNSTTCDRVDPSRLFVYYNARKLSGETSNDSGVSVREALKAFKCNGVCKEFYWPYNIDKVTSEPTRTSYERAKGNSISKYERISHHDIDQFRACLKDGCPFVFAFGVYESFYCSANQHHGKMPMPTADDKFQENHAVMAVGYNDNASHFIILNSWGKGWGDNGYFYMPYDFIKQYQYCFDFWKISFASEQLDVHTLDMHMQKKMFPRMLPQ